MKGAALLAGLALAVLLLVNLAFYALNPARPPLGPDADRSEIWTLSRDPEWRRPDPEALLASGLWGRPEQVARPADGADLAGELGPAEGERLRRQLRGISRQGEAWRVLFQVEGEGAEAAVIQPLAPGDFLPGTDWRLSRILGDRLELRNDTTERTLRLFDRGATEATEP